jgi:hypothetical protein
VKWMRNKITIFSSIIYYHYPFTMVVVDTRGKGRQEVETVFGSVSSKKS